MNENLSVRNSSLSTPGPWQWLPDEGQFIVDENMQIIAEIPCQGANPANGPLLAAAPELRDALRECLPFIDDAEDIAQFYSDSSATKACRDAVAKARSVLAKL